MWLRLERTLDKRGLKVGGVTTDKKVIIWWLQP